jgi:hemerythrin superfamily protein
MYTPPQDIADIIAPQHEHVKELLDRVRQAAGQGRAEAFYALRLTLALHETAEEQAIHPQALRQLGDYDRPANDRIAEEQTAAQTIRALEMLDVDSDQFNYSFEGLASSIADHATAEENDEWPALRHISDVAVLRGMAEQMRAVTELVGAPTAPGMNATFEEMRQWAKRALPRPPESQSRAVVSAGEQAAAESPVDPPLPGPAKPEKVVIKPRRRPGRMLVSMLAGMLAGAIIKRVWKVIGRARRAGRP